jgi:hypothetical protein
MAHSPLAGRPTDRIDDVVRGYSLLFVDGDDTFFDPVAFAHGHPVTSVPIVRHGAYPRIV